MLRYDSKRLVVAAERFDLYHKPWPRSVETVIGDIGVPHPVIIGVQGNINLSHGDWIVYLPCGVVTMNDTLFNTLFTRESLPVIEVIVPPLEKVQPLDAKGNA